MIRKYPDLFSLIFLALTVCFLLILDIEIRIFSQFAGILFALFAPGYTITAAIFKGGSLEPPAKIALSIGISMAISAVGGVLLYATGVPLTTISWVVFYTSIIFVASAAGILRRERKISTKTVGENFKISFSELLLLIISISTIAGSIYIAWNAEENQTFEPFTEFWILPLSEEITEVEIGIRSAEQSEMTFNVSLQINGEEVNSWEQISVYPEEEWKIEYPLPPKSMPSEAISVFLMNSENPDETYRWVQINR